tara:strand:+ start:95 stop:580 length:486 start_codon:yes stop_codon:yes gene_type:complete
MASGSSSLLGFGDARWRRGRKTRFDRASGKFCDATYVRTARRFSEEIIVCADEHLDGHDINFRLDLFYLRSVWLEHFYGDEGYREYLREAVLGLVQLLQQSYQALGPTHDTYREIKNTLHDALSYQLDWSLDDLKLDSESFERLMVVKYADLPTPNFDLES